MRGKRRPSGAHDLAVTMGGHGNAMSTATKSGKRKATTAQWATPSTHSSPLSLPSWALRVLPLTLTMTMRSVNKFYAGAICIGINIFVGILVAFVPLVVVVIVAVVALC